MITGHNCSYDRHLGDLIGKNDEFCATWTVTTTTCLYGVLHSNAAFGKTSIERHMMSISKVLNLSSDLFERDAQIVNLC